MPLHRAGLPTLHPQRLQGTPPTLRDFYRLLKLQPEPEAQGLALASELFITGTLNTFAKYTNVDTQARIIDYDIRELGEQLMPLGDAGDAGRHL